jgi:hypothetical protein
MAEETQRGAPKPDWYPDPNGVHEYRYWNGTVWTGDVSDSGRVSVDPLPELGCAESARGTAAGYGEQVLLVIQMATDVTWGGYLTLHVTEKRLVVEKVMSSATGAAAVFAGGLVGAKIVSDAARRRGEQAAAVQRTPDEILQAAAGNYAIDYRTVSRLVLKQKALPIGHSRCKITSSQKNVTLAFKREYFDQVAGVMRQVLGDLVEVA